MKKLMLYVVFIILVSCEGSDAYQGGWKATDINGNKFEIVFTPKSFSVSDYNQGRKEYAYSQNSVQIENSVKTYGINLDDGRRYKVRFPTKDRTVGLILNENDVPMYVISRDKHINYNDLYKLD